MATSTTKPTASKRRTAAPVTPVTTSENMPRGILFALGAPLVGIIGWVVLWRMGVIASLISFAIAFLAVWLYERGAGTITRKSLVPIISIILLGVFLAFMAGVINDIYEFYITETPGDVMTVLNSDDFWATVRFNFFENPQMWPAYTTDIMFALGFAALGTFSTIRSLFTNTKQVK